jgi:hypothetical protein
VWSLLLSSVDEGLVAHYLCIQATIQVIGAAVVAREERRRALTLGLKSGDVLSESNGLLLLPNA